MLKYLVTVAIAVAMSSPALAGSPRIKNTNVSQSGAISNATNRGVNNSTTFKDRRQAPGMAVGGGDCSQGGSLSIAGFGGSLFGPAAHCRIATNANTVGTAVGKRAQHAYVCYQREFRMLRECGGRY